MLDPKVIVKVVKSFRNITKLHKTTLNILKFPYVEKGQINLTNLDMELTIRNIGDVGGCNCLNMDETCKTNRPIYHNNANKKDYPTPLYLLKNKHITNVAHVFNIINPQLKCIVDCLSTDYSREPLRGMYLSKDGEVCATDGHRMITVKTDIDLPLPERKEFNTSYNGDLIFQQEFLQMYLELQKYDVLKSLHIHHYKDYYITIAEFNEFILTSKSIDSTYPNYKHVIPETTEHVETCLDSSQIVIGLKTMLPFTNRKTYLIEFEDSKLKVNDFDNEKAYHYKLVKSYYSKIQPIGFNAKYLHNLLSLGFKECKSFSIGYSTKIGATVYKQDNVTCVLMPLRIKDDEGRDDKIKKDELPIETIETVKPRQVKRRTKKETLSSTLKKSLLREAIGEIEKDNKILAVDLIKKVIENL
jgi:hypothetical protein